MHFGPCYLGSKGLQNKRKEARLRGELPGSFGCKKNVFSGRVSFSFLMDLLKTIKLMSVKSAQKHFRSVFGQHKKYPQKSKLKR